MRFAALLQRPLWKKAALQILALLLPTLLFQFLPFLRAFELQVADFMAVQRGPLPASSKVILVTVDDRTVAELGSPLSRAYYAQALRALHEYGAKAVAVDLLFSEEREPQADEELAHATSELGNVIHAFNFESEHQDGAHEHAAIDTLCRGYGMALQNGGQIRFLNGEYPLFFAERFVKSFSNAGHVSAFEDEDGRFRRFPLLINYDGRTYPALSLAALCEYLQTPVQKVRTEKDFWGRYLVIPRAQGAVEIPVNHKGEALLNFYGQFESFESYSLADLLEAKQDLERRQVPRIPLQAFKDKIVVLGNTETGEQDALITPFSGYFPGAGFQATAISNFLEGETLRRWPWYAETGALLLLLLLGGAGAWLMNKRAKAPANFKITLFFFALLAAFNGLAFFLLFQKAHVVLPLLQMNATCLLLWLATSHHEKSAAVQVLNRKVRSLEEEIGGKLALIGELTEKIGAQGEQHKVLDYFTQEIERILANPSLERLHPLETPLLKLLENQKIIKEKLEGELERLRLEKAGLEAERQKLESERAVYRGERAPRKKEESAQRLAEQQEHKLEQAREILADYKTFVQKHKAPYHIPDSRLRMVAAPSNGKLSQAGNMHELHEQIARLGVFDSTVLITGETGTGKELVAQALHRYSARQQAPFIALNCAAIPESLIESELFGHEKGAFTNALMERRGAFEQAHRGVIFLDEIGDLKPEMQAKLLRVLQDKIIRRVGGSKNIEVDARVFAATHRDLQQLRQRELFRDDLFFRLDVANLHLPPLRARREDVPHLAHFFLENFNTRNHTHKQITDEALLAMIFYDWPGNVRELQNQVEKICINAPGEIIHLADLLPSLQQGFRDMLASHGLPMWANIITTAAAERQNLLLKCQALLHSGNVEERLRAEPFQIRGQSCENVYDYLKIFLDNQASLFPPDQRETLAKQTIVTMQEQLYAWCKEEKLGKMEPLVKDVEKLLGRTRRMVDNWRRELGMMNHGE